MLLDPQRERFYNFTVVCLSVCMYVCHENQLCQFFENRRLQFSYSSHDERGHQYLSNGEGPMSIDALGDPFWALFRPKFAQKLTLC